MLVPGQLDGASPADITIWDTPAHPSSDLTCSLIDTCDRLLVVANPDVQSQGAALSYSRILTAMGGQTRVLFNQVAPTGSSTMLQAGMTQLGAAVLPATVRRYACYMHAYADGRVVVDWQYPSADAAWSDITRLAAAVEKWEVYGAG